MDKRNKLCPGCRRRDASARIPLTAAVCSVDCGLRLARPEEEGRLPSAERPRVGEIWTLGRRFVQIVHCDPAGRSFDYIRYARHRSGMEKQFGHFGVNEIDSKYAVRVYAGEE